MPRCAIIARCGACRVAPAHITMRSMSLPLSAAVAQRHAFLLAVAPHRDVDLGLVGHGEFDFAEARDHLVVDGQQRCRPASGGRRPASRRPGARWTAPGAGSGLAISSLLQPLVGQAEAARRGQRLRHQLRFERVQRTAWPARGGACPARCRWRRRDSPAAGRGRCSHAKLDHRPITLPVVVDQHAVEIAWARSPAGWSRDCSRGTAWCATAAAGSA